MGAYVTTQDASAEKRWSARALTTGFALSVAVALLGWLYALIRSASALVGWLFG